MTGDDTVRLTYAQLARKRGVSIGAAKRMAQRHRWPRQIGNDGLSRVSVPATFLVPRESVPDDVDDDVAADVTGNIANIDDDVGGHTKSLRVVPLEQAMAALAEVVRDVTGDVVRNVAADVSRDVTGDVISTLREQLQAERERANRVEIQLVTERDRANRAEGHARELQEQLASEIDAHRRVVESLVARIPARRSWLPWRR